MVKFTKRLIELRLQGWEPIPASRTEDDCFIVIWLEKRAGTECDRDPFGDAIQGTTRDRYIQKVLCYDKYADIIEEARV